VAGPGSLPTLLACQSRVGTLFNTFTTAKRVQNDEDVFNVPGNYMKSGAQFRLEVAGAISNVVTTPGNIFFQVMMGPTSNIIAWTSGNLALNATARTLLPFELKVDLRVDSVGPTTSAKFLGQGWFQGVHLTNTDARINVPTTAPAVGTGWDSVALAGNVMELYVGFSNSQAGNGVQLYSSNLWQLSGFSQ
jgi:hypothetical protein